MEAPVSEVEYLASEVILNSKPVSYHKFSRQLSIPISQAKQTLYEYYTKNKEQVSASFVITGVTTDGVKTVKYSENEENLKHDVGKFNSITTIHVFCVMKKDLSLTTNEIALEELKTKSQLSKIEEYEKNGIIIGPKIDTSSLKDIPVATPTQSATPPSIRRSDDKQKLQQVKSSGLSSSYVSRKQQSQQQTKPVYTSRKQEANTSQKRAHTEPATPSYQYKSRKLEKKQPKERIVMGNLHKGNDEDIDDDDVEAKRKQAPPPTTDLEKLFDEDESFQFSDEEVPEDKGETKPSDSSEAVGESQVEDQPEQEANADAEPESNEADEQLFVEEEGDEGDKGAESDDMETVKEVDEDGYTVTRRKPKSVTKPVKKPAPAKRANTPAAASKVKKPNKDGKKKTQSSLMNFFGKR